MKNKKTTFKNKPSDENLKSMFDKGEYSSPSKFRWPKNFIINFLIAFIPTLLIIGILSLVIRGALINFGILFVLMSLVGKIRKKSKAKNNNKEKER